MPSFNRAFMPPKMPYQYPNTTPLSLTATATVASNSSAGVNSIALKNPMGQPMEILEVRFQLNTIGYPGSNLSTILGGMIYCKMDLGEHEITNGFVPTWCFGKWESPLEAFVAVTQLPAEQVYIYQTYIWKLPKPLYVPAGSVLIPTFQHTGLFQNTVEISVTYNCRSFPVGTPPPEKLSLPYVAAYTSKTFERSETETDESTETDLVNPFSVPLHIQRFVGRLQVFQSNVSVAQETPPTTTAAGSGRVADAPTSYENWQIKMVDMLGRPIVQDFTPFRMVFDAQSRSWEMDNGAVMDPNSYIIAYCRKAAGTGVIEGGPYFSQAFISVVGWRDLVGGDTK